MKFRILTLSLVAVGLLLPTAVFAAAPKLKKAECYKIWHPEKAEDGLALSTKLKGASLAAGDMIMCIGEVSVPKQDKLDDPKKDLDLTGQIAVKQTIGDKETKVARAKFRQAIPAAFEGYIHTMVKLGEEFDACKPFEITISAWGKAKDVKFKAPGGACK